MNVLCAGRVSGSPPSASTLLSWATQAGLPQSEEAGPGSCCLSHGSPFLRTQASAVFSWNRRSETRPLRSASISIRTAGRSRLCPPPDTGNRETRACPRPASDTALETLLGAWPSGTPRLPWGLGAAPNDPLVMSYLGLARAASLFPASARVRHTMPSAWHRRPRPVSPRRSIESWGARGQGDQGGSREASPEQRSGSRPCRLDSERPCPALRG